MNSDLGVLIFFVIVIALAIYLRRLQSRGE